jgi:hypothetical protein
MRSETNIENRADSQLPVMAGCGVAKAVRPVEQQSSNPILNSALCAAAILNSLAARGFLHANIVQSSSRVTGLKFKNMTAFTPRNQLGGSASHEIAVSTLLLQSMKWTFVFIP